MPNTEPRFTKVYRSEGDDRSKFDIQLEAAIDAEDLVAQIFQWAKIELKTESWQWERTGNIAIEFARGARATGMAATEADYWMHEVRIGEGEERRTACYVVFPIEILRQLCQRASQRPGGLSLKGGDGGISRTYLLRLSMLFSDLAALGHPERP